MREIRTSGLTRGRGVSSLPTLLFPLNEIFEPGFDRFSLGFRPDRLYCLLEQGFINLDRCFSAHPGF